MTKSIEQQIVDNVYNALVDTFLKTSKALPMLNKNNQVSTKETLLTIEEILIEAQQILIQHNKTL